MQPVKLTNLREVVAFFLAQVVKHAIRLVVSGVALAPVYIELIHTGHAVLIGLISIGINALLWFAALPLFLLLRALFGGVPWLVAAPVRERAFTSSGGEIGAYALAYVSDQILSGLVY